MSDPRCADELLVAADWLRRDWGIDGQLSRLPGYEDTNYRVRAGEASYVFRISHALATRADLVRQNRAMQRAAAVLPGAVPRPVASRRSRDVETDERHPGRLARLLTYVDGQMWVDARPVTLATHRSLGAFLARLDIALVCLDAPRHTDLMVWDLCRAGTMLGEYVHELPDTSRRALVLGWIKRFNRDIAPTLERLPKQFIHNDANDHNLLVRPGEDGPVIAGIIDFAAVVESIRVAELAIAVAYAIQDEVGFLACAKALFSGYHALHPLTVEERAALPVLVAMRLCTTVVFAARNLRLHPENTYFQSNARPGWRALEQWTGIADERFQTAFSDR